MSQSTDEEHAVYEARMGHAIVQGILIGLPTVYVVISLALFLLTDRTLGAAATTAIIPSVLLGVFGGGFVGVARTMD